VDGDGAVVGGHGEPAQCVVFSSEDRVEDLLHGRPPMALLCLVSQTLLLGTLLRLH
jgi:hypothetical protein